MKKRDGIKKKEKERLMEETKKELEIKNLTNMEVQKEEEDADEKKVEKGPILLKGEDVERETYYEHFASKLVEVDQIKINGIEDKLKDVKNISKVSTTDLLEYLQAKSQNREIDPLEEKKTRIYLDRLKRGYVMESIFSSQGSYPTMVFAFVLMLVPFYYFYPRFYEGGFWGILSGMVGMMMLVSNMEKYRKVGYMTGDVFYKNLPLWIFIFSILLYGFFFVFMSKLNHYSLFWISMIVVYLLVTYILRLVLLSPLESNRWKDDKLRYEMNEKATVFNNHIEVACSEINKRLGMGFPDGKTLYQYLAYYKVEKNKSVMSDFLSAFFQPVLIGLVLTVMGLFLNEYKSDVKLGEEIYRLQMMPMVGYNEEGNRNIFCQANYILPDFVNYERKIQDIVSKRCFDPKLSAKITDILQKVGQVYLDFYRPEFRYKDEDMCIVEMSIRGGKDRSELEMEILDKREKLLEMGGGIEEVNREFVRGIYDEFCREYHVVFEEGHREFYYRSHLWMGMRDLMKRGHSWMGMILGLISPWLMWNKMLGSGWVLGKYIMGYIQGVETILDSYGRDWMIWRFSTMGVDRKVFEWMEGSEWDISWINVLGSLGLMMIVGIPFLTTVNNMVFGFQYIPKYMNYVWGLIVLGGFVGNLMLNRQGESLTQFNMIYIICAVLIAVVVSTMMMMGKKK